MTLWLALALMTAAAVFAVLWPLAGRVPARGGSDTAVYRDQLDEIARDRAAGLIGETEAEAAKVEVSRRLIAAAEAEQVAISEADATAKSSLWRRRSAAVAALVLVPAGAVAFYLFVGSPQLPGAPLAERLRTAQENAPIANLVAQAEKHLERNPNDPRGYEVLAPVYLRLGRFADAVAARQKVIALSGETAERQSDLGEAITAQANGIVTADARRAFERAVALNADEFKARFFLGVAAEQDGKKDAAAAIWRDLLAKAPADAPWIQTVRQALAGVGAEMPQPPAAAAAPAPGPSREDMAAAAQMTEKDRGDMIRGMVERLAGRLKENADDIDGWQRLLRAYMVLGEREKAQGAASDARKAFAGDADKLRRIDETIKSLGLAAQAG